MKNKILTILFLLFIFSFTLLDIIAPDREFSEWENRELKQTPTVTLDTLLSGEFSAEYEEYLTDQFAPRDLFVKAKFIVDKAVGKTDSGGVYLTDSALYPIQPDFSSDTVDKNIKAVSEFARRTSLPTALTVVPTSTYIYREDLPPFAEVVDEELLFEKISEKIDSAEFIDLTDIMRAERKNYIYFRTDHHWTADGALLAYNAFMGSDLSREDFVIEERSESFLGTLSSRSGALGIEEDVIESWTRGKVLSCEIYNGVESKTYPSIYFDEFLDKKDKYSFYLGQNQPLVRIKTDSDRGRLIIFKDSYAHSFSQLLIGDWSEIVLVDMRYVKDPKGFDSMLESVFSLTPADFDRALFLYSADTFTTQYNMLLLNK